MIDLTIRPFAPEEIDQAVAIDDDACALYEQAGLRFEFDREHPFARGEYQRWLAAAREGTAFLAEVPGAGDVGLLVMRLVDGVPYLDQLAVRSRAMRQGIGRRLVARAVEWAAERPLWLTTYAHLAWNRPFYERLGFVTAVEAACSPAIVALLEEQRRWLPAPSQRIAMCRLASGALAPR